jgi:serine/threonine-protein kinase
MALEAGQVIEGKYRIVRVIGTGGMGAVYEGENILIRRRVAIKVLHAAAAANNDAVRRFEREAQAAGEIGNDHILEVLDIGSLPTGERFMVMEYLDGETLGDRLDRVGRLTPEQVAPIARQFLTALASAHEAGIIHRDLKPENIFILRSKAGRADFVKLIDFGISKFQTRLSDPNDRMTRAGAVLGTPCYMSPEQARGKGETDVRSDIYACGVILYETATGQLPFRGDNFNDLMFNIALSEPTPPLKLVPSLDPDFAWLISRAMAKVPAERFQTVQEFAEALDGWMRRKSLTSTLTQPPPKDAFPAREAGSPEAEKPPSAESKESPTVSQSLDEEIDQLQYQKTGTDVASWAQSHAGAPAKRRRGAAIAAAVAAGVLAIGVAIAVFAKSSSPPPEHTAASARTEPPAAESHVGDTPVSVELPPVTPVASASALADKPAPRPNLAASARPRPKPPASSSPSKKGFDLGY